KEELEVIAMVARGLEEETSMVKVKETSKEADQSRDSGNKEGASLSNHSTKTNCVGRCMCNGNNINCSLSGVGESKSHVEQSLFDVDADGGELDPTYLEAKFLSRRTD
ncbi:hypothetical protein Ancab_004250, partial [Ancistrocladus abbreviatus]